MIKLVGFQIQSGNFTNKDTGEVVNWSNCLLRTVTDENLLAGEYGQKIGETKVKSEYIASSLGVTAFDCSPNKITEVIQALQKCINRNITFNLTLVKGNYCISGIKVQ